MTETEFNLTITIAFVATVIVVWVGFARFLKWRRAVITNRPTPEELLERAKAIDAKYRAAHPELDDDFAGTTGETKADKKE